LNEREADEVDKNYPFYATFMDCPHPDGVQNKKIIKLFLG
jgi:hypothetical protein